MKMRELPMPQRVLIPLGLLLAIVPFLVNDWVPVPDFVRGFLMGMGIIFEIVGIVAFVRRKNQD